MVKLVLLSLLLAACGELTPSKRVSPQIYGGEPVKYQSWIAQRTAALYDPVSGKFACTGVFIDQQTVVTAAHCIKPLLKVMLPFRNESIIGAGIAHSQFSHEAAQSIGGDDPVNDIGLVILPYPMHYAIPSDFLPDLGKVDDDIIIAGYGAHHDPALGVKSGKLRFLSTKMVEWFPESKEIFLAGPPRTGACHGDSGGPAWAIRNEVPYLVGVTSRGLSCGSPTAFTDVRVFVDWIATTRKNHFPPDSAR